MKGFEPFAILTTVHPSVKIKKKNFKDIDMNKTVMSGLVEIYGSMEEENRTSKNMYYKEIIYRQKLIERHLKYTQ